jgi:alanine-glyoxylate transaminase/serine-glyoxylate transaminase/serine-pyruvate transaminase
MGLSFLVKAEARLPQVNVIQVPPGVDEAILRRRLLQEYNLEVGAGLGALAGKVIRIGLMGYGANMKNVMYCLEALEAVLFEMRAPIQTGVAMNAAQSSSIQN